jgi:hypothetical protein
VEDVPILNSRKAAWRANNAPVYFGRHRQLPVVRDPRPFAAKIPLPIPVEALWDKTQPTDFIPEYNVFEMEDNQVAVAHGHKMELHAYEELAVDLVDSFIQEKYQLDRMYELQQREPVWQETVHQPVQPIKYNSTSCRTQLPDEYIGPDHFLHQSQNLKTMNGQYHGAPSVYDGAVGNEYLNYFQSQPQVWCTNCGLWGHYLTSSQYHLLIFGANQSNGK